MTRTRRGRSESMDMDDLTVCTTCGKETDDPIDWPFCERCNAVLCSRECFEEHMKEHDPAATAKE